MGKVKEGYIIQKDDITGLWHAIEKRHTEFSWRTYAISLGYPMKNAYQRARELGLYKD